MGDLVVGDITTTVNDRRIAGKKRINDVKLVFGDGAKTYPTGGIPLPTFESLGFVGLHSMVMNVL